MPINNLEQIQRVKAGAEDMLLRLPGVVGVDVGRKMVNGARTDQMAIRVYVQKKQDVPTDQLIPATIHSVPTDVIERDFTLHSTG